MKILVTGATGFIGRPLVRELLARGHEVVATSLADADNSRIDWLNQVHLVECDLFQPGIDVANLFGPVDATVHLAWIELRNYWSPAHIEKILPASHRLLNSLVQAGCRQILVAGTNMEFGLKEGCLSEEMQTQPFTLYGLAKDTLRKSLEMLQTQTPFTLQWARLYYMYGEGQRPETLMGQLDAAIKNGDKVFNMSGGKQIRDYLPVAEVARKLAWLVERPEISGPIHICSGKPVSVFELVVNHITQRGADIRLNPGHFPYLNHEPMASWGKSRYFPEDSGVQPTDATCKEPDNGCI